MKKVSLTAIAFFFVCIFCFSGCSTSFSGRKTVTPTQKPYPEQDKYDFVLAEGDGYYLVTKYEETYSSAVTLFGIVTENGDWILPLSSDTVFNEALEDANGQSIIGSSKKVQTAYKYYGSGLFFSTVAVEVFQKNGGHYFINPNDLYSPHAMGCYFFNVYSKKSFSFAAEEITEFDEGQLLFYSDNRYNSPFYSCDENGNVKELPLTRYVPGNTDEGAFPTLSEGLFYYDRHFYSISGKMVIDLSMYDLINTRGLHFTNGECCIQFKNPGGTVYYATIDKQGNFLVEPHK